MKTEAPGWEPITEVNPSENFMCTYGGSFAQNLAINRRQIETFLDIASLDGRVLLQESKVKKPQTLPDGINPDGSVSGRGSLRWGQKIETEDSKKKQNPYFQVEPDEAGWVISVNGDLIQADLAKKGLPGREMAEPFADKFEFFTRVGLKEALLKDKFSYAKDQALSGRFLPTGITYLEYYKLITNPGLETAFWAFVNSAFQLTISASFLRTGLRRDRVIANPLGNIAHLPRRTIKTPLEMLGPSLELDRALVAYGYLDLQKVTGKDLVRATSD
jgi:hypothetical protein